MKLAEIYTKFMNCGCLFFENFTAQIYCDFKDQMQSFVCLNEHKRIDLKHESSKNA